LEESLGARGCSGIVWNFRGCCFGGSLILCLKWAIQS
jgi:hypothetical protein